MKIAPARKAAFGVLLRVEVDQAYSSALLPLAVADLSDNDRSLCYEITLGTLRHQIFLDHIISLFAKTRKLDVEVRIALRMALYQLRFLDRIPAYSAVNDAVNLVDSARKSSAKGFVNALLRHEQRQPAEISTTDSFDRNALLTSHPRWLLEKWARNLGFDEAIQLAAANNKVPAVAFRVTTSASVKPQAIEQLAVRSEHIEGCFLADRFEKELLKFADAGQIYFQDEASQMAAAAVPLSAGTRFLDVCAAPGGKTTLIAASARANGIDLYACAGDIRFSRVELLRENCEKKVGGAVDILQYDAQRALPFADESFDSVLVDVPCSGTGTIRHNPEIRYHLKPSDIEELPLKQLAILVNASKLVTRGGILVYSTCSVEREENEDVCDKFMASAAETFIKTQPEVAKRFLTSDGYARTWPHRDAMDGFFIAALKRI